MDEEIHFYQRTLAVDFVFFYPYLDYHSGKSTVVLHVKQMSMDVYQGVLQIMRLPRNGFVSRCCTRTQYFSLSLCV